MFKDENLINLINLCIGKKKLLNCFSGRLFLKTDAAGQGRADFYFYSAKTDVGTFF